MSDKKYLLTMDECNVLKDLHTVGAVRSFMKEHEYHERTCHNLYCEGSDLGEGGFRCSRCDGEMYGDEPNYCCHCGTKVVQL